MSLYLLDPIAIQIIINGTGFPTVDVPTKTALANHFLSMPASVREPALNVMAGSLPTDEGNFCRALFSGTAPDGDSTGGSLAAPAGGNGYTYRYDLTALTGGTGSSLDAVATVAMPTASVIALFIAGDEQHFQLRPTNGAGFGNQAYTVDGSFVIQPRVLDAGNNARVWGKTM